MMHCLHLTLTTDRGGRRDAILTLIRHLRRLGVTCGLVGLRDTPAQIAPLAAELDFAEGLGLTGRPTVAAIARLWHLCRTHQVEVLHVHDAGSQAVASILRCALPKLRIVMTFHRTLGFDSEGRRNHLRNRLTLPLVSRVITASAERRRYFIQETSMPEAQVVVIPHGAELASFHPDTTRRQWVRDQLGLPADAALAIAVGHFGEEKGIDVVIAGFAAARARMHPTPVHLVVLGEGTPEQTTALAALADRSGGGVTFAGFRRDVANWLQGADLMIHAPRLEAFGLVTIQAMACGIPVIATEVGGIPEIVVDGVTGLLTPAEDPESLGAVVAALFADPARRATLGAAGRSHVVAHFDAAESARQHLAIYSSLR